MRREERHAGAIALTVDGGGHLAEVETVAVADALAEFHALEERMVEPELDQAFADRERHEALCIRAGHTEIRCDFRPGSDV